MENLILKVVKLMINGIYSESNQTKQYFKSADDLINNALINGILLNKMWSNIVIDYIL